LRGLVPSLFIHPAWVFPSKSNRQPSRRSASVRAFSVVCPNARPRISRRSRQREWLSRSDRRFRFRIPEHRLALAITPCGGPAHGLLPSDFRKRASTFSRPSSVCFTTNRFLAPLYNANACCGNSTPRFARNAFALTVDSPAFNSSPK